MPTAYMARPAQACLCLDSGCSSVDGSTQGMEAGRVGRGAGAVLIGTEDRGQEERRRREEEWRRDRESSSPPVAHSA